LGFPSSCSEFSSHKHENDFAVSAWQEINQLRYRVPPLRTQTNGKCNDVNSSDKNKFKQIALEPLFKNYTKTIYSFIGGRLRSCVVFKSNNAGLMILKFCLSGKLTHLPS
jgi:hypothetical protein